MKQLKTELAGGWWESMSNEHKQEYVKEHPNSKYAAQYRKEMDEAVKKGKSAKSDDEKKPKTKKESEPTKSKDKTADDDKDGADKDKDGGDEDHKVKEKKRLFNKFKDWMPKLSDTDRKFFESDGPEEGSAQRRKMNKAVKDKSFDIVATMKNQVHEWKTGVKALHKIASKQPLNDHDKEALKVIAKDTIIIIGTVALGGGLAHGLVAALHHIGTDFLKDAVLKSVAHALVEGYVIPDASRSMALAADADEKFMQKIIEEVGDFIGNGHIPDEAWEKAIKQRAKSNNVDNEGDFDETLPKDNDKKED